MVMALCRRPEAENVVTRSMIVGVVTRSMRNA